MERTGTLVLAAILGVAGGLAGARIGSGGSNDHTTTTAAPHTVTVVSTAAVGTSPDQATLSLVVTTDDPSSSAAYSQNQTDAAAVVKKLEADGVLKKDIKTSNISLYPHTVNRGKPNEQTTYTASETLTAIVRKLDSLGTTLSDAVAAGADRVQGVTFGVSDPAAAREKALASAVAGARLKADTLAQAAGSRVTGVVRIQEGQVNTSPYAYRGNAFSLGGVAVPSVPNAIVAPHEIKTQVTVTVVWAVA